MRLFHDTIEALDDGTEKRTDAFAVVDEAVGWAKLLRAQGEVTEARRSRRAKTRCWVPPTAIGRCANSRPS